MLSSSTAGILGAFAAMSKYFNFIYLGVIIRDWTLSFAQSGDIQCCNKDEVSVGTGP